MNNTIYIYQSRFIPFNIEIVNDGEPYHISSGEKIAFGIKKKPNDTTYIIYKEIQQEQGNTGIYSFNLTTDETNIDCGDYHYDIAIITSDNEYLFVLESSRLCVKHSIVKKGV